MCILYRDELKVKSMEVTGTIKLARTCCKNGDEKLARKVHEAKEDGKRKRERPRKTWEEEVRKTYTARGEKWEDARKCAKTEKGGNTY